MPSVPQAVLPNKSRAKVIIAGKVNQIPANHEHFPCLYSSTMGTHGHLATNLPGK